MRYFYDTEFLERGPGHGIDAISLGMVSEGGATFYVEFADAPWEVIRADPWLRANVVPYLRGSAEDHREGIRRRLLEFWQVNGWPSELWAYYSAYDHVVLSQVFGRMIDLPDGVPMFSRDLKVEMDRLGVSKDTLPPQDGVEHHALADAWWVRDAYLALLHG